jgi:hypothetical protein
VIDFYGLSVDDARRLYPSLLQKIINDVKPHRDANVDRGFRERWWLWGRPRPDLRRAVKGLDRFIVTLETSTHKPFVFVGGHMCPDHKLYVIASDDAKLLGVLSSRPHSVWALAAGGRLGVGNDPTWTNGTCFLPFPFPAGKPDQQRRIRELGEALDAHRKRQQAAHPALTLTGIYNVLEKLRTSEPLTAKERTIHEQGLVSVLKDIHDRLDEAVLDAYGWPRDIADEDLLERLVALNAERAEEERRGLVRWLRPDLQAPAAAASAGTQAALALPDADPEAPSATPAQPRPWPATRPDQARAVAEALAAAARPVTPAEVAAMFDGAPEPGVADLLAALTTLGHARKHTAEGGYTA